MDYEGRDALGSFVVSSGVIAFLRSRSGMSRFSREEGILENTLFENDVFQRGFSDGIGSVEKGNERLDGGWREFVACIGMYTSLLQPMYNSADCAMCLSAIMVASWTTLRSWSPLSER